MTLLQAQKTLTATPVVKLTIGSTVLDTYIERYKYREKANSYGRFAVWLENADDRFGDLAGDWPDIVRGASVTIERGLRVDGQELTANMPTVWIETIMFIIFQDRPFLLLDCVDWAGRLRYYRYASETTWTNELVEDIVSDLLAEVGLTLASGAWSTALQIDYKVSNRRSLWSALKDVMSKVPEVLYAGLGGEIQYKVLDSTEAADYDYGYNPAPGSGLHPLLPDTDVAESSARHNSITVAGGDDLQYSGTAEDSAEIALLGYRRRRYISDRTLGSNAECASRAEAELELWQARTTSGVIVARPHFTVRLYDVISAPAPLWGGPAIGSGHVTRIIEWYNFLGRPYEQALTIGEVPNSALVHLGTDQEDPEPIPIEQSEESDISETIDDEQELPPITEDVIDDEAITTDKIADDAVTAAKIAADVAGDGLVQAVGGELDVNVDGTSIQIVADTLQAVGSGIDHGDLSGLGDDDHSQYHNNTRGDARYTQRSNNLSDVASAPTSFSNIKQAASTSATGVVELATSSEVAAGTDSSRAVVPSTLASNYVAEGEPDSVSQGMIVDNAVNNAKLASNSVANSNMQNDAVDTAEIADGAVDVAKLATNAVSNIKIQNNAVDTAEIATGAVTVAKMDSGAATSGQVLTADGASGQTYETPSTGVTDHGALTGLADDDHSQYHNNTRGDARYTQRSNNLSDVASAPTSFSNIKQSASTTTTGVIEIATSAEVAAGTDTDRAVVPSTLASNYVAEGETDSVTQSMIVDLAVNSAKLASNSVSNAKMQNNAIDTAELATDSVTAVKINADVAGDGLGQAAGGELDVNVDGTTIQVATDTLEVVPGGIKLDDLGTPDDNTDLDASTSRHGLLLKLGGGSTNFLRADGTWSAPPGTGGGEANTASNVGAGGVGVFKQKAGIDLEFKNVNAGSSKITVTDDAGNNEIDIDVAQGNLDHGSIGGLGGDDHTQYHNDTRGDARYFQQSEHISTSAGAGDSGKPIVLDAGGKVDATMVNDGDIDHGSLTGLSDDDHSQYHNNTRGDARYTRRSNNLSDVSSASTSFSNIKQAASTSATGVVELATQTEVNTGTDSNRVVSPATLEGRSATATRTGVIELATSAEVATGTDTDRAVVPSTLAANYVAEGEAGSVSQAMIVDLAVSGPKMALDTIAQENMENDSIGTPELINNAVTSAKIAAGQVDTSELATDAVTNVKMANNAIDTAEIADNAVTPAKLAAFNARVYNSGSSQTISTNSWTVVTFNMEWWDNGGFHSTVTNTSRLTVPAGAAGKYVISGVVSWAASGGSALEYMIAILHNGSTQIASHYGYGVVDAERDFNITTIYDLAVSDYVELRVRHIKGSDLNVVTREFALVPAGPP